MNDAATAATALEPVAADRAFARREEAMALLGAVYLGQGNAQKALGALDNLLKEFPRGTQVETGSVNRAQALYRLGRFADSGTAVRDFLKAYPASALRASAMFVLALDQRGLGDEAAAGATLKQVVAEFPNSPFVYQAQLLMGETLVSL